MQYTNHTDIPFVLAVWLAADGGYDLVPDPTTISATSLLKPTRSVILGKRIQAEQQSIDIVDLVQAKLGTAVHTAVEEAWLYHRDKAFKRLGIPDHVAKRIVLNPDPNEDLPDDALPIYMEQRSSRELEGWTVSGKFDVVWQGAVEDVKTTKTFNFIKGSNDEKYSLQGSVYRWLNQDIIKEDYVNILMIFTDWSELKAKGDKTYPQKRVLVRKLPILSVEETESWVRTRLMELNRYKDAPQADLPACTPEELWMDPPKWAYYKDKSKMARATKLFNTAAEAQTRLMQDGNKGIVVKRDMEPKFCRWCPASPVCTQAEGYIAQGILKV